MRLIIFISYACLRKLLLSPVEFPEREHQSGFEGKPKSHLLAKPGTHFNKKHCGRACPWIPVFANIRCFLNLKPSTSKTLTNQSILKLACKSGIFTDCNSTVIDVSKSISPLRLNLGSNAKLGKITVVFRSS